MYLTWLADAARETGYPVNENTGWQSRGHGGMTAAHGVVNHWTAGPAQAATTRNYPSLAVVRDGRPGLDGPLAGLGLGFDGTIEVIAAGRCYHAGVSAWRGETDLNDTFVGVEVESPGGFVYTAAQNDCLPRLNAALLRRMARSEAWATAHYEVATPAGRKPDGPSRDMPAWRQVVGRYLANPAQIRRTDQEDVTIVDAATKTYLDGKFAEVVEKIRATGGRLADVQREGLDGRALILKAFGALDPAGVSDAELQRMAAIIAEAVPVLAASDVVDALAARPLVIGPKTS